MTTAPPPPAAAPSAPRYIGFWARLFAALIDTIWVMALFLPPICLIFGTKAVTDNFNVSKSWDQIQTMWQKAQEGGGMPDFDSLNQGADPNSGWANLGLTLLTAGAVLLWWMWRNATPGKLLIRAVVVDAATLAAPSPGKLVVRYLGYYVSMMTLGVGFLWIMWDPRKRGLHDYLAGTVVIRKP
jgi:uncharacterized RDD family membrane protein YckC